MSLPILMLDQQALNPRFGYVPPALVATVRVGGLHAVEVRSHEPAGRYLLGK